MYNEDYDRVDWIEPSDEEKRLQKRVDYLEDSLEKVNNKLEEMLNLVRDVRRLD